MKKFYILLEDDWELRGKGLGNVAELQYIPSLFLMDLCNKLNIKMTFMVDVAQQLKFSEYLEHPEIKVQKELWDNNVRLMKQRGFDVQLHLHPQWIDAKYENGFFYVNDNWNIGTYEDEKRSNLVKKAVEYLKELLTPIDADYKTHSFKPGSWGIQPSEGIIKNLSDNGINLIIGMNKGLYIPSQKIDYRNQEEDIYPYYPNLKDITQVSDSKQNIIAVPLTTFQPRFLDLFNLLFFLLKKKLFKKVFGNSNIKADIPQSIKDLNPLKRPKFNNLLKPYTTHLKLGNQPYKYLKSSFDNVIKRLDKLKDENLAILMEAHTKDFTENYDDIEKFLRYIVEKYNDKVEFITLSEFIKKTKDNQFSVKCKKNYTFEQKFNIKLQIKFYLMKLIKESFLFNKIYKKLIQSQFYTQEQLEELQNKQLKKLIKHCYKNVPYYKELFKSLNLKPEDIQTKEDLKKLPCLDKYKVRDNYNKLISKTAIRPLCYVGTTGGTTGTPGKFLRDIYSIIFETAIAQRFYRHFGDNGLKRVTLRENVIIPPQQIKPPFWEYNQAKDELIMSPYHLSKENAPYYVQKIIEFNPQILYLQPSTASILAEFFKNIEHNLNLKTIFTSSENLYDEKRKFIENVFKTQIHDWYGQAERVAAIGQCEKNTYHIIEDYSIVELLEVDGNYEICGTSLYNFAMPLLRYKTGDFVVPQENKCSCGRHFREVKNIQGRDIFYILTPEQKKIMNIEIINMDVFNVIETQYIQKKLDELIINVVTNDRFNENDRKKLIQNVAQYISPNIKATVNQISYIPRSPSGKFINVIREFKIDENQFLKD